jgi:hypothetical protein
MIPGLIRILPKNLNILKVLNPEGKTTVRREYLLLRSSDFHYHTHQYFTRKGK